MTNFTKAEFLTFLYEEKNRELQNNSIPGWSKWAIWGVISSAIFYIYNTLINATSISYTLCAKYFIPIICCILLIINLILYSPKKHSVTFRVRYLHEEAPWVSYVTQWIISVLCAILHFVIDGIGLVFYLWITEIVILTGILLYILFNRNRLLKATNGWTIFKHDIIDLTFKSIVVIGYGIIGTFSIKVFHIPFSPIEFQVAFASTLVLFMIFIYIRLSHIDTQLVKDIDNIIDSFIEGKYTQERAYQRYLLAKYGKTVYEIIEPEQNKIDFFMEITYPQEQEYLNNILKQIEEQTFTLEQAKAFGTSTTQKLVVYKQLRKTLKRMIDKLSQMSKLENAFLISEHIKKNIKDILQVYSTFEDLANLTHITIKVIEELPICNEAYKCRKYGSMCTKADCLFRNDKMSFSCWWNLTIHRIRYFFTKHKRSK